VKGTDVKRHNLEFMIAWLDALRRRDTDALAERLAPETTWRGIRPDLVCHGREEVIRVFVAQRDQNYEVDALELIGAPDHAILHAHAAEPRQIADNIVDDGMYNVFRIEGSAITQIEDYLDRDGALRAAGLL
jgi:limonene-1,2-epoxide hydrolase